MRTFHEPSPECPTRPGIAPVIFYAANVMRKHVLVLTPAPAVMNARLEQMNKDSRHVRGR